jgi:DNA-directed RNA polymerase subunit omega
MILPFEELIENDTNAYEFTVAVTRRAYQLAVLKTPEVEKNNGKVVSLAMRQVFSRQVEYRFVE